MKNMTLLILLVASFAVAVIGGFMKIMTKGSSGNEIMLIAFSLKGLIIIALIWKNRNAILPWLKQ